MMSGNHGIGLMMLAVAAGLALVEPGAAWAVTQVNPEFNPNNNLDGDNNTKTGKWDVPSNWSGGKVPGTEGVGYVSDPRIYKDTFATLDADASASPARTLSIGWYGAEHTTGRLDVASTGKLSLTQINDNYGGVLNVSGTVTMNSLGVGGTATFAAGSTINLNSQFSFSVFNNGTVNINGGTVKDITNNPPQGGMRVDGGTVNQTAGSVTFARALEIGRSSGGIGVYNKSGGTISFGSQLYIGAAGTGTFNLTGGSASANGLVIDSGGGTGLLSISGGTFTGGRLDGNSNQTIIGNNSGTGSGTLQVIGNQGVITLKHGLRDGSTGLGNPNAPITLFSSGTLNFVIGSTGVSTISVNSTNPDNNRSVSYLVGKLDLDLANGFTPQTGATYDLLTTNSTATYGGYQGLYTAGLALAAEDSQDWAFDVLHDASGATLRATYVPEPGSMGLLLGLGGLAMVKRRRRRLIG